MRTSGYPVNLMFVGKPVNALDLRHFLERFLCRKPMMAPIPAGRPPPKPGAA